MADDSVADAAGLRRTCDTVVAGGLVALVLFAPLAVGAVDPVSCAVLQAVVALLALLWLAECLALASCGRRMARVGWILVPPLVFSVLAGLQWADPGAPLPASACRFATRIELCRVVTCVLAFVVVATHVSGAATFHRLLVAVCCAGVLLSLLAGCDWALGGLPWPFGERASRVHIPPVFLLGYLAMAAPIGMARCALRYGDRRYGTGLGALVWLGATVLMLAILALVGGFVGMVGVLAAGILIALLLPARAGSRARAAGVLLLAVLLAGCLWPASRSAGERLLLWADALRMWRAAPVFGSGLGTFAHVFPAFKSAGLQAAHVHAASEPFELLAEMGIAGAASVAVFLVLWYYRCLKGWRRVEPGRRTWMLLGSVAAVAGVLAQSCVLSCLRIPANAFTCAVILGVGWALGHEAVAQPPAPGTADKEA